MEEGTCSSDVRCCMVQYPGPFCMRTVPWSPRSGQCVPPNRNTKGHNLFNVLNSQESGLKVNQPASFAIRLNGAKGKIDAKVHSPSGAVEECHVSELEPGERGGRADPGICASLRHVSADVHPHGGLTSRTEASQPADPFCCSCQALFTN